MLLFLMAYNFMVVSANIECTLDPVPKYYPIEKCHRSRLGIAAKANFSTLSSCKRLAIEKKALALNFSPPRDVKSKPSEYTCEVLKCAESEGGLSLNNDTNYDYYSIYAKYLPNINSTCVPLIGMFYLRTDKVNYTQAQTDCQSVNGVLAGVFSEQRTDALALILASAGVESAYVGLSHNNGRGFRNTNGDPLDCNTYRAWAPGHPKRNNNMSCVVLTRKHTWQTTLCHKRYQALCELLPTGPYKKGAIFVKPEFKPSNSTA